MDALQGVENIEIVEEQSADWDNAQALALTQDWLNKYPKGELHAIIDQGPEGATAAQFAKDNGREEIKFLMGDYPADVKAGIEAGSIYGTVNQDPYPQGTTAVDMACLVLTGRQAEVPTPNVYLPLPIVTAENVADYPPAVGRLIEPKARPGWISGPVEATDHQRHAAAPRHERGAQAHSWPARSSTGSISCWRRARSTRSWARTGPASRPS